MIEYPEIGYIPLDRILSVDPLSDISLRTVAFPPKVGLMVYLRSEEKRMAHTDRSGESGGDY